MSFVCFGCSHSYPEYDSVPQVEYLYAATAIDSSDKKIQFVFQLTDGDGNFGLEAQDTTAPYIDSFQQNMYAKPYYIENNDSISLPYILSYRIPRLRAEGDKKFIKAKVAIDINFAKSAFPYDSIFFTYFVFDRDLNQSNIDTSEVIVF
ncbi:MAG: hypothetical protein J6X43_03255 [Bacteroidales bacterium]|nr:hypothetical protein [Bacteroidales bacterium]